MKDTDIAVDYLLAGRSCAQAILMAYGPRFGMDRETASRLAAGFAGGMFRGDTCGAVSAAVMVAGLAYGSPDSGERYTASYCTLVTQEFCHRFCLRQKSVECRQILERHHVDPKDPEQIRGLRASGICTAVVRDAQEILDALLEEEL